MIRLNVFLQVEEAKRNEVIKIGQELVAASLKDDGCIAYDLFESTSRGGVLMICETWRDASSLAAHEQASHFVTLVPKLRDLAIMKLEKFEF